MIIKKYYGESETEAIMLAKEDLGKDAIVTNIKKITPKGIFKLFRKPQVEITAAVDDASTVNQKDLATTAAIEEKIEYIQSLLEQQTEEKNLNKNHESLKDSNSDMSGNVQTSHLNREYYDNKEKINQEEILDNPYVEIIYRQLLENGTDEEYIKQIFSEIQIEKDFTLKQTLSQVYQKIILKLGQPKSIEVEKDKCKFIFFIGPTGVGKTTTIAKIASHLSIYKDAKVALLTLDTYRIAAVEQLKTYSNILELPLKVIYSPEEFNNVKDDFAAYDIVLVDTAGMSYRNKEKQNEIEKYLNIIDKKHREVYLVLSATTKYEDLINITKQYKSLADYKLIFTKLDETSNYGCILNIKMLTDADLSYITTGQIVPDDILVINTQHIAKQLLGGIE